LADVAKESSKTIPDKAKDIANQVKRNNGAAPQGYKGGKTYKNIPLEEGAQKLPEGINYKEYDVNPYVKGQNRGAERIVIGNDSSVWYTSDHYNSFTRIDLGR
jgi:guanyl-specific ribonuclease Sa